LRMTSTRMGSTAVMRPSSEHEWTVGPHRRAGSALRADATQATHDHARPKSLVSESSRICNSTPMSQFLVQVRRASCLTEPSDDTFGSSGAGLPSPGDRLPESLEFSVVEWDAATDSGMAPEVLPHFRVRLPAKVENQFTCRYERLRDLNLRPPAANAGMATLNEPGPRLLDAEPLQGVGHGPGGSS
jgi:hypothetical protein